MKLGIVGLPNVGKSTLINNLAEKKKAKLVQNQPITRSVPSTPMWVSYQFPIFVWDCWLICIIPVR